MANVEEIKRLRQICEEYGLEGSELLVGRTDEELARLYNGIGPEAFPQWLRAALDALHPSLAPVAFIHDVEWSESDGSEESFAESNDRFRRNGITVACATFGWWRLRRYKVMWDAWKFARICQRFGWSAWRAPYEARQKGSEGGTYANAVQTGESYAAVVMSFSSSDTTLYAKVPCVDGLTVKCYRGKAFYGENLRITDATFEGGVFLRQCVADREKAYMCKVSGGTAKAGYQVTVYPNGRDDTGNTESSVLYVPDLALDADLPSGAWLIGHKCALRATGGND